MQHDDLLARRRLLNARVAISVDVISVRTISTLHPDYSLPLQFAQTELLFTFTYAHTAHSLSISPASIEPRFTKPDAPSPPYHDNLSRQPLDPWRPRD